MISLGYLVTPVGCNDCHLLCITTTASHIRNVYKTEKFTHILMIWGIYCILNIIPCSFIQGDYNIKGGNGRNKNCMDIRSEGKSQVTHSYPYHKYNAVRMYDVDTRIYMRTYILQYVYTS